MAKLVKHGKQTKKTTTSFFLAVMMLFQRLEMCIELIRLSVRFVIIVAEAVGVVIQQNGPPQLTFTYPGYGTATPFVGFMP